MPLGIPTAMNHRAVGTTNAQRLRSGCALVIVTVVLVVYDPRQLLVGGGVSNHDGWGVAQRVVRKVRDERLVVPGLGDGGRQTSRLIVDASTLDLAVAPHFGAPAERVLVVVIGVGGGTARAVHPPAEVAVPVVGQTR